MAKYAMNHGVLRGQDEGHIAPAREALMGNLEANTGFEITHTGDKFDIRGRYLDFEGISRTARRECGGLPPHDETGLIALFQGFAERDGGGVIGHGTDANAVEIAYGQLRPDNPQATSGHK